MDHLLIGQNLSGYIVDSLIGAGGMGRVYQAHEIDSQAPAAIKVMLPEYAQDENFRQRFLREAQLMITLRHPHLIPVYTFGTWQDYIYIIMQIVRGPSLETILKHRSFTPLTAWQIVRPVTDALGYGHANQVLHRDLKTGNILIEKRGEGNHVFLGDFGLGKRPGVDITLTATGVSVGTPEYMAPEVALGTPADPRADLYSMGVIIYELLLGKLPFKGRNPQMTALAHVDQPVPLPRTLHPQFPRRLQAVLLQTLEKDPVARYQSAEELQIAYYDAVKSLDDEARRLCYWTSEPN
ncbi:MAG TPA: serine/threonine-protein kinase [Aggregatilineaceae bacterium]|nr:serine/threonine-protein kinase [Aggregatilineaceae bacterium]